MHKLILPIATFALLALNTQSAFAWGMPSCNISNANETICKSGKLYRCRLNGVGSTDPDSGKWVAQGTCSEGNVVNHEESFEE